jgi:hypothetical protein
MLRFVARDLIARQYDLRAVRPVMDIYDGADWTEMDIEDLKAAVEGEGLDRTSRSIPVPRRQRR